MKRFNALLAAVAVAVAAVACGAGVGEAQTAAPQKIGFVDMAEVFKNYRKFTTLRDELKAEFDASEQRTRALYEKMRRIQGVMKDLDPDSPAFAEHEKMLGNLQVEMEADRRKSERDLMARQSEMNKTIYLEVVAMVNQLARTNHYSVVLRVSKRPDKMDDDPAAMMQWMNNNVVVYDPADDLTNDVIYYLNERYPANNITPVGNTVPGAPPRSPAPGGVRAPAGRPLP